MPKTISLSNARKKFSQITDEVKSKGVSYTVLKNGKPSVRIIPESAQLGVTPAFKKHLEEFKNRYDYDLKKLAKS